MPQSRSRYVVRFSPRPFASRSAAIASTAASVASPSYLPELTQRPRYLVLVPRLPVLRGERLPGVAFRGRRPRCGLHLDDLPDRQAVFLREREVALVVRRNAHHRAVAVRHQHVVADPHLDRLAGQRMRDGRGPSASPSSPSSRGRPPSRCRAGTRRRTPRAAGCRFAACAASGCSAATAQKVTPMIVSARVVKTYMRPSPIGLAVGSSADVVREREAHTQALADPVRLHRPHALGPSRHPVQVVEQLVGVVGDPQVVHRDLALLDRRARSASRGRRSPARSRARSGRPGPS